MELTLASSFIPVVLYGVKASLICRAASYSEYHRQCLDPCSLSYACLLIASRIGRLDTRGDFSPFLQGR